MADLKHIIEAAVFSSETPVSLAQLRGLFDTDVVPTDEVLLEALADLTEDYADRAIELKPVASGYVFETRPQYSEWIERLWPEDRVPRYSRATLETLAIIAYRQPVTRAEIEAIRGVSVSSSILKTLHEREWIQVVGYREVPGRPELLGTTPQFLDHFGLKTLSDMPTLTELGLNTDE